MANKLIRDEEIPGTNEVEELLREMRESIEKYMKGEKLLEEIRKKAGEFLGVDKKEKADESTLELKKVITTIRKETEKSLDPAKGMRAKSISYFKNQIPKELPRSLKSILRSGIYQVWMASNLQIAIDSFQKIEKDYYKEEMSVKCKIRNYNNLPQANSQDI